MSWNKVIIIVLAVFVLFITGMSLVFFMSPVDDYDHQYYEKGLNFDRDYNREVQVAKDHAKPVVAIEKNNVKVSFLLPAAGIIKFMRPSDTALDKTFTVSPSAGKEVAFPISNFPKGQWQIELQWESNQKAYLDHQEIYIK